MNHKLKALGLALVAVFAMSAVVASGASAAGEQFHSTKEHTILSATAINAQKFTTTVSPKPLECAAVGVDGTIQATTAKEITATPTYSNCTGEIGGGTVSVRVTMTTCNYIFTSEIPAGKEHSVVHIECGFRAGTMEKDEINVEIFFLGLWRPCVDVPEQTPTGGGVTYTNNGNHVDVNATVTGITYTETGVCGVGESNNGTYTGKATVMGKDTEGKTVTLSWK